MIDETKCTGCKLCLQVCPYDALYFNEEERIVDKCNLCVERIDQGLKPACVATCMNNALVFGDLDDPENDVSKSVTRKDITPLRQLWPAYYGKVFTPSIHYTDPENV